MYTLDYSETAVKQLKKLPNGVQERILIALERLRIRPKSCDIKRLVEIKWYRFRVGDYRIIFEMEEEKLLIFVIEIGHRKNVYDNY